MRKKNTEQSALHPSEGPALLVDHFHLLVVVVIASGQPYSSLIIKWIVDGDFSLQDPSSGTNGNGVK